MNSCVGEHCVLYAVFTIKPTKGKTESTVHKEATSKNDRGKLHHRYGSGYMCCGKKYCRNNICDNNLKIADLLLSRKLMQQKSNKRHKEESKHNLFNHATVSYRCDNVTQGGLNKIAVFYNVNKTTEKVIVP